MLLFELIIGKNQKFYARYKKLNLKTQEQIYMFFFTIEGLTIWTILLFKIIKG
jgi:hypothetical protein